MTNLLTQTKDYFTEAELAFPITQVSRTVADTPYTFRIVMYPDGRQALQGGYSWYENWKSGTIWKEMPVILVDDNGMEFEKDVL